MINNNIASTQHVDTIHLAPLLRESNQSSNQITKKVMFSAEVSLRTCNDKMTRQEALRQAILRTG